MNCMKIIKFHCSFKLALNSKCDIIYNIHTPLYSLTKVFGGIKFSITLAPRSIFQQVFKDLKSSLKEKVILLPSPTQSKAPSMYL